MEANFPAQWGAVATAAKIRLSARKAELRQGTGMKRKPAAALAAAFALAAPAEAGELFGGLYAHAVETPLSLNSGEGGVDIELGYRGGPIAALRPIGSPAPYAYASVNTAGDTGFLAAGLAWKLDLGALYVRPGVGLSLNNGPERRVDANGMRTDLGSRVLFAPELGLGIALGRGASLEASWVHISGAQLFNSEQNPGVDMIGVRFNQRL